MTDQHPLEKARITRDRDETGDYLIIHDASPNHQAKPDSSLVERVAQWGYDQRGEVNEAELQQARDEELEACCGWLVLGGCVVAANALRAARRPKPPSLKEQALEDFHWLVGRTLGRKDGNSSEFDERSNRILSALEALPGD